MRSTDHTTRGCTTLIDLDTQRDTGVNWLVVPSAGRDTLYITHHDTDETVAHVFIDPGERQGLRRVLAAILQRPARRSLSVAAD